MYLAIHNQTDNNTIDSFIEKKLNRATSRYTGRLSVANIKVENVGGTNSVLKRCQMEIQTSPRGVIRVKEEDENLHAAVSRAVRAVQARLSSSSDRQIAKSRKRYRSSKKHSPTDETT